jgi:hypothetical protein
VPSGADPRSPVHVQPDVVVLADSRLTGVNPHAHPHVQTRAPAPRGKPPLPRDRGSDRVACPRESDEERVTLSVDLVAFVLIEHGTKHLPLGAPNIAKRGTSRHWPEEAE